MTTLAPLANLLAIHCTDPPRLERAEQTIAASGRFTRVWRPHAAWVIASQPLPFSVPDSDGLAAAGVAFVEGRDRVEESLGDVTLVRHHLTPAGVRSLRGDVGFVAVEANGTLTVVRSAAGLVPFYVHRAEGIVVVATTYTEAVRWLATPPEPDPLVCALWASHIAAFPDHRTFLRGIEAVPPGGMAVIDPPGAVMWTQWWDPAPPEVHLVGRAAFADAADEFRRLVTQRLDRDLLPGPGNLLTMSGGTDSSTLAYLAVRELDRPLSALSFVPTPGPALDYEMSYLRPVVDELGIAPHRIEPITIADRFRFLEMAPRLPFFVMHPALAVLPSLVESHRPRVLVGGEFADEVCGGIFAFPDVSSGSSIVDRLRRFLLVPPQLRMPRSRRGTTLPTHLQLAPFVRDGVMWEWDEVVRRTMTPGPWWSTRARLSSSAGVSGMNWEVCASLQVRRSWPFLQRELLELVWSHHPLDVVGPTGKRLIRAAFEGRVPERILHRPDKGRWRSVDEPAIEMAAIPQSLFTVVDEQSAQTTGMTAVQKLGLTTLLRFWTSLTAAPRGADGVAVMQGEHTMDVRQETTPAEPYESPKITDLGSLSELTEGSAIPGTDTGVIGDTS